MTITVSQLNRYLKSIVDDSEILRCVHVSGEISNYVKYNKSGHIYMTLKDDVSSVKVVIFNSVARYLKMSLENGMSVTVNGKITVYERDGNCQIIASSVLDNGIGDVFIRLQLLKEKLLKEGLFDPSHKLAIPKFPGTIGVITSGSGAALQDIINTVSQRYPLAKLLVYPVLVQGTSAAKEITQAVQYFSLQKNADTILIARGGGSAEDLHTFNDEQLARAVYDCPIPTISSIGHETDTTILDLVADVRASTPTFGAMAATPDKDEIQQTIAHLESRLSRGIEACMKRKSLQLELLKNRRSLQSASYYIDKQILLLSDQKRRLENTIRDNISVAESLYEQKAIQLDGLSPLKILQRGYSVVYKDNIPTNVKDIEIGDQVKIRSSSYVLDAQINGKRCVDGEKENF